ncbi:MAG: hypothetical protein N3B01_07620 [Verrucomicrobiae bacterium]|nr:hypothetical protein [Verrucomicrobiae bacterium]
MNDRPETHSVSSAVSFSRTIVSTGEAFPAPRTFYCSFPAREFAAAAQAEDKRNLKGRIPLCMLPTDGEFLHERRFLFAGLLIVAALTTVLLLM